MKILFIEYDLDLCETVKEMFEMLIPTIEVICANDLETGLDILKTTKIDVLILDHFTYRMSKQKQIDFGCYTIVSSTLDHDETNCLENMRIDKKFRTPTEFHELLIHIQNTFIN